MKIRTRDYVVLAMLGALTFVSKQAMEFAPNVHLIAVFITAVTVVYRKYALYTVYVFVFLTGLINGFALWWIPYLYIWTVLWAAVMLLPKNMSEDTAKFAYMTVCGLHGLLYGTLYAPFQAIAFHLDFKGMLTWIVAGFPWDIIHGVSNFWMAVLILPFIQAIKKAQSIAEKSV